MTDLEKSILLELINCDMQHAFDGDRRFTNLQDKLNVLYNEAYPEDRQFLKVLNKRYS
jgi:hypothetical protein